jgi:hypothetical protein
MGQYNNCLDSFTPSVSVDCVSNFTMCLDDGVEANTCASYSAQVSLLFIFVLCYGLECYEFPGFALDSKTNLSMSAP